MPSGPELEIIVWVIVAIISGIGELLTGSFFLLPFAIGAVVAALAAAFGAELVIVLPVFLVVSLGSLVWLRRFADRFSKQAPVIQAGAGRYLGAVGMVTSAIKGSTEGRVQLEGQMWRARTAHGEPIEVGTTVRVVEVRGTALVVEAE
ncbi:MAG: NfeD family protein [Acidimicrobiia bacterium]|nr:NfeD family protein [Acidimicrobiia bacterium]